MANNVTRANETRRTRGTGMSAESFSTGPGKISCSGDQFDLIVAFAEAHGLLHAHFHDVVSQYTRRRMH
jgi:hypothetical protein